MMGTLTAGQIQCLEARYSVETKQTDKGKVSLVLMTNAYSRGDHSMWEQLVKRHLDEVDQSNPDLCYKYALRLSKKGASRATEVIKWSDVALENRTVWTGSTYTSRVYSLYKFRTLAAQTLWKSAEDARTSMPTQESKEKADHWRDQTKVMAREWYEYAKVAGKDTTTALQVCMSAAGTREYCEAG